MQSKGELLPRIADTIWQKATAVLVRRLVIENAAAHADARCCSSLTSAYFRLAVIDQDWATDVYTTFQSRGHAPPAALTAAKDRLRHPRHERPDDEAGSTNANRCPGCAQYLHVMPTSTERSRAALPTRRSARSGTTTSPGLFTQTAAGLG